MLHNSYLPYCQSILRDCISSPWAWGSAAGIQGAVYFVHGFFQAGQFLVESFSVVSEFTDFLPDTFLPFFTSHMHTSRHKFFYIIYAGGGVFVNEIIRNR